MIKKIWSIFARDVRVNSRDFISLYIIIVPILFAIAINIFAPGINDTTVNIAMLEGENPEQIAYLKDFAKVELFEDVDSIQERVERRDNIVGIVPEGDGYYIMIQGNEPESVVEYAKLLKTFNEMDTQIEDTTAELIEFGKTVPPTKKLLVNVAILFASILGGMLIALNIVEEKMDNTISAVNVTTISRLGYILGKSMIGLFLPVFGSLAMIWIVGYKDINIGQLMVIVVTASFISMLVGFIEGINNDDIMSAAGNLKMLFFPLAASAIAVEMLDAKWQKFFYWIPFYWAYKGNDAVLSYSSNWPQILLYAGITLGLCGLVFLFLAPKIRKGLE